MTLTTSAAVGQRLQQQLPPAFWTNQQLLVLAFLGRLFLVLYARIHDYMFEVHFTDIDYRVFSEAAQLVRDGKSPYEQPTYRYTPLISWLLVPNYWLFADFGKLLFCAVDVLVGWLQLHILDLEQEENEENSKNPKPKEEAQTRIPPISVLLCWLFNPFIAVISARGNADAIICALIMATLYALMRMKRSGHPKWLCLAALIHGAGATHFRIFPLIYLPSVFLSFTANSIPNLRNFKAIRQFVWTCLTNLRGFAFILISLCALAMSIWVFFLLYGHPFLDAAFLYHLGRVDVRHNFSPYFLPLYLAIDQPALTKLISLIAFVPQLVCITAFAVRFSHDLPFCWFLTTFAFVSFNKVCTSQYFIWYLCFLPLLANRIKLPLRSILRLLALWLFGQAHWLLAAYLLEFRGWNTFVWTWLASLAFLGINCLIIIRLIGAYQEQEGDRSRLKKLD